MKVEPVFNDVIHAPLRFRICGLLRNFTELEFSVVRDSLEVSDPTLSKHLKVLTEAGFVKVRKETSARRDDARRLTWISLTKEGTNALRGHLAALSEIAGS